LPPSHTKKTSLDSYSTIVKSLFLPHGRKNDYEKEREVTNRCLDPEQFVPDPDPISEKFQIRSGSYLAQYGFSNKNVVKNLAFLMFEATLLPVI
jgi:hypothetical protein